MDDETFGRSIAHSSKSGSEKQGPWSGGGYSPLILPPFHFLGSLMNKLRKSDYSIWLVTHQPSIPG